MNVNFYKTVGSGVAHWVVAAAASVMNFVQHQNDRGDLIRAGLFLMMGTFYFWMHDRHKKK